jgi:hypothetical protein
MVSRDRIKFLHKESEELLHVVQRIERALQLALEKEFSEHVKSMAELHTLDHGLAGIIEHCNAENRLVDSSEHIYGNTDERARIDSEHQEIVRAVINFREELRFATADRTMAMILPGMDLVNRLRAHIAYERELLDRIDMLPTAAGGPSV